MTLTTKKMQRIIGTNVDRRSAPKKVRPTIKASVRAQLRQDEYLLLAKLFEDGGQSLVLTLSPVVDGQKIEGRMQMIRFGEIRDVVAFLDAIEQFIPAWWAYRKSSDVVF